MTKVALGPRTWATAYVRGSKHAYTTRVLETKKKASFLQLWLRFGMNPTLPGSHSKPHFFHYVKSYIVYFQNTQKSHGKNTRFTRK